MVFTSAATSLRMSCAILVPSRMGAGIQAPVKFYRMCREKPPATGVEESEYRNCKAALLYRRVVVNARTGVREIRIMEQYLRTKVNACN